MTVAVVREPLYRTAPDCRTSYGDFATRVGADLGLPPDPEQQWILDRIFAEREPGIPASRHVAVVGPRQQIKTSTLVIAAATDLYVLGVPEAIWTAHQSKTATKSYEDLSARIRANPEYARLTDFRSGRGEELIFLPGTPVSLEFRARSGGSGRGFTTDRLTLDEALFLRASDMAALLPTMLTRKAGQVRYGSSAGKVFSEVLRSLRDRGRAGTDPRLTYVEYGSQPRDCVRPTCSHAFGIEGCALDDRELWWQGCSALWYGRVTEEDVADLRRSMPPEDFACEVLVWWQDPITGGAILDPALWDTLTIGNQTPTAPFLSVEVALDRSRTTIGSAWKVDGRAHVEVFEERPGVEWVPARMAELVRKYDVPSVVVDGNTEAASIVPALEAQGVKVLAVKGAERATACAGFFDLVTASGLSHNGDPALSQALASARWKDVGEGARAFSRRRSAGDIAALYAVTLALHGLGADRPSVYEEREPLWL